jgi:cyclopropane fatty-acyl-phospholipid synthase-like methyltransferase
MLFAERAIAGLGGAVTGHVLEIGSRNINGSVRPLFAAAASYTGIDLQDGPDVDVQADGATYDARQALDTIVCTEVLEHTPVASMLIQRAARQLVPGGWLLLTCATDPRVAHSAHDGGQLCDGEYYGNVAPADLRSWLKAAGLATVLEEVHAERGDLYVLARKAAA